MSTTIKVLSLLAATMTTGFAAGVFLLYAHTIMPGLRGTDDRTFVAAFQALDRAIVNPWFMVTAFMGALASTAVAALANGDGSVRPWILAALGLYLVAFVVTVVVHLPLNDAIKATGARASLHEGRWVTWNLVRVATSGGAFGCLAWALVQLGRATA